MTPYTEIRTLNVIGVASAVLLVGGIGTWASTTEIAGAVIAPGTVAVESGVKAVQHPTGGVVSQILVKSGSHVEKGQVLIRLDDTVTRATLRAVRSQLDEDEAKAARLQAEQDDDTTIAFPPDLMGRKSEQAAANAMDGERKLFLARKRERDGEKSELAQQIAQTREEIRGLSAELDAKKREIVLIKDELTGVTSLYNQKLVPMSRLKALQRRETQLEGQRGDYIAKIARSRGKISELRLQILQLDKKFYSQVVKDLREAQNKIVDLVQRAAVAQDRLKRIDIRAPQAGTVFELKVHTIGAVIHGGDTIMRIVPKGDPLVIQANVPPKDIDQVSVGTKVMVRILAGNLRTTPEVAGTLTEVSPDLTQRQKADGKSIPSHYRVRVALAKAASGGEGRIRLVPGMPAEAFIETDRRTPMQYLLKPLRDQIARVFRER